MGTSPEKELSRERCKGVDTDIMTQRYGFATIHDRLLEGWVRGEDWRRLRVGCSNNICVFIYALGRMCYPFSSDACVGELAPKSLVCVLYKTSVRLVCAVKGDDI